MKATNQGKELKNAIRGRGMRIEDAASLLGMSRQSLHNHLVRAELDTELIQNVKKRLGIIITEIPKPEKNFKGVGKIPESILDSSRTELLKGGELNMSSVITMSIADLLQLQRQQDDPEVIRSLQEIISYKQHCEYLKRENELLQARLSDKDQIIQTKDQVIAAYQSRK